MFINKIFFKNVCILLFIYIRKDFAFNYKYKILLLIISNKKFNKQNRVLKFRFKNKCNY